MTRPRPVATARYVPMVLVCALVFVLTASLRFLRIVSFSNDEYISLAGAQQLLFGEWPTRDFLDTGQPLMFAAAATAQHIFGHVLYGEAMLTSGAYALAAVLTVLAVKRLSGSLAFGVIAALVEVAFFPRGYAYPKILLYAAAPLVIWWYQNRPTWSRALALAAFVQIAFLFRHDHGLYIGAAATVAVAMSGGKTGAIRDVATRTAMFAVLVLLMATPYLVYVAANDEIGRYLSRELTFRSAEVAAKHLDMPPFGPGITLEKNYEAFLFYLFYLLPVITTIVLVAIVRNGGSRVAVAQVAPLIVLALMVDRGFLRAELWTRLVDAFVPAALLFAWLCGQTARVSSERLRWSIRTLAIAVACLSGIAVTQIGRTAEQLNRAGLFGGLRRLPERFVERSEQLHERFNKSQMPSRVVSALVPFFEYVNRCTTVDDRLLLPGFIPEVAVYARRPVAGGRLYILPHFNDAPDDRLQLQARLSRQTVPFVLVTPNDKDAVWTAYPEMAGVVRDQYRPLVTYTSADDGEPVVYVFVSQTLKARGIDSRTGWPCFV